MKSKANGWTAYDSLLDCVCGINLSTASKIVNGFFLSNGCHVNIGYKAIIKLIGNRFLNYNFNDFLGLDE